MSKEITLSFSIRWTKGGGSVSGSINDTVDQTGNAAFENVQAIGTTTEQIVLGDVSGSKHLMLQNRDATDEIHIDTVTPVVPGSGTAIKLLPGANFKGGHAYMLTALDTWYAIASANTPDLLVVAIEE